MGEKAIPKKSWNIFGKEILSKETMTKIMEFDQKLVKSESTEILLKMLGYFIEVTGLFFVLLSYGEEDYGSYLLGAFWIYLGIYLHLYVYIGITENNKRVSIYGLLRYLPINIWDVYKVRLYYIGKILLKRFLLLAGFQLPIIAYTGKVALENILTPVLTILVVGILCVISVLPVGKNIK
ncbi:MAG: hypothetical protein IJA36_03250 [Lachnospiraceae bacterium]|nr:hypothetical protein [Lachnospiraceae bacterium]